MLINAIGTYSASQPLESMAITRRDPGPQDVQIAIAYCGVCHSDLHQARSEWAGTLYPLSLIHICVGPSITKYSRYSPSTLNWTLETFSEPTSKETRCGWLTSTP